MFARPWNSDAISNLLSPLPVVLTQNACTRYPTSCSGCGKSGRTVACLTNVTRPAGSWPVADVDAVAGAYDCFTSIRWPDEVEHRVKLAVKQTALRPPHIFAFFNKRIRGPKEIEKCALNILIHPFNRLANVCYRHFPAGNDLRRL